MLTAGVQNLLRSSDGHAVDALARLCQTIRSSLGARRVSVWLYDPASKAVIPSASDTEGDDAAAERIGPRWWRIKLDQAASLRTVLHEREAVTILDAAADGGFDPAFVEAFGLESLHMEPLLSGGPVGALIIEPAVAADHDELPSILPLVSLMAAQVRGIKEADQRRREAELLFSLTEAGTGGDSFTAALHEICRSIARHTGGDRATIWWYEEDGQLRPRMSAVAHGPEQGSSFSEFRGSGEMLLDPHALAHIRTGEPVVINDVTVFLRQHLDSDAARHAQQQFGSNSFVMAQLGTADDPFGILAVDSAGTHRFRREQVRLIIAAAQHVTRIIERARETKLRDFHLRVSNALRRLLQDGSQAGSVLEAAQVFAEVTREVLIAEHATVLLADRDGDSTRIGQVVTAGAGEQTGSALCDAMTGQPLAELSLWQEACRRRPWFAGAAEDFALLPGCVVEAIEVNSAGMLPVWIDGRCGGMVLFTDSRKGRRWGGEYELVAEQLMLEGSLLLDRARLRELEAQRIAELSHQALHDGLTGLANRRCFIDRLEHALLRANRSGQLAAVLFIDVDRFKTINDTLGHEVGDELLCAFADRLRGCLREVDTVARLGGDEFTVLVEDVQHADDVVTAARRIAPVLEQPLELGGRTLAITCSIGIALARGSETTASELLRNADLAMYRGKRDGKRRFQVFDPDTEQQTLSQLDLENDLAYAVERNELVLHYQPVISLVDQRVVGMEALVRWQHPERGMVPPGEFIPLAETNGAILQIGQWVLDAACAQLRAWQDDYGVDVVMWVNLSARQLHQDDIAEQITCTLHTYGLRADQLGLEITENVVLVDSDHAKQVLALLRGLGVHVAIDDFGTGYSSLTYLRELPVDTLKIDRSFIHGLGNPADDAIVQAVATLAETLDQQVVAEGIETAEQLEAAQALDCTQAQGFYFARPAPAEHAVQHLVRAGLTTRARGSAEPGQVPRA